MPSGNNDSGLLSESARTLENDFDEMERIRASLAKFNSGAEINLEQAQKLLAKFGETGLRIADQLQVLTRALDGGRERAEAAREQVAQAVELIQKKNQQRLALAERLQALAQRVGQVSASLGEISQSGQDNAEQRGKLPGFQDQLAALADEAVKIREEAKAERFKDLEREADTMADRLKFSGKKIRKVVAAQQ